jgi:hypothetical protein
VESGDQDCAMRFAASGIAIDEDPDNKKKMKRGYFKSGIVSQIFYQNFRLPFPFTFFE